MSRLAGCKPNFNDSNSARLGAGIAHYCVDMHGYSMPEHILPIMQHLETDFLVDRGGKPVWPVRNPSEEAELQGLAHIFGSTIKQSGASSAGSTVPLSDEVVCACGEEAKEPARLYAHLTGRHYAAVESFEALKQHRRPAILVTTLENVTSELLRYLYEPPITGM